MSEHKHLDLFLNVISSSSPIASLLPPIRLFLPLFPLSLCCFLSYLMWLEPILKGNTKCTFTSSSPQLFHVDTVALQRNHKCFVCQTASNLVPGTCQLLISAFSLITEIQYGVSVHLSFYCSINLPVLKN